MLHFKTKDKNDGKARNGSTRMVQRDIVMTFLHYITHDFWRIHRISKAEEFFVIVMNFKTKQNDLRVTKRQSSKLAVMIA